MGSTLISDALGVINWKRFSGKNGKEGWWGRGGENLEWGI